MVKLQMERRRTESDESRIVTGTLFINAWFGSKACPCWRAPCCAKDGTRCLKPSMGALVCGEGFGKSEPQNEEIYRIWLEMVSLRLRRIRVMEL